MTPRRSAIPRAHLRKLRAVIEECSRCPERVLFLDVETTGLDPFYDDITVIGWSFDGSARTMIRGADSYLLRSDLERAQFLVTFNGGRFDTRFIARAFPGIVFPRVHLDLMYVCRCVGLTGGQKEIERAVGISLRDEATNLDGATAVMLWRRYLQGHREALRRLILYNRTDVAAMGAILDEVVRRMNARVKLSTGPVCFLDWSAPSRWRELPEV